MKINNSTVLKIGISVTMVAIAFVMSVVVTQMGPNVSETTSAGMDMPLSYTSEKSSIEKVKQTAQFVVKVPTKMPSSSLKEVYADKDGSGVMILYSDPNLKSISHIGATNIASAEMVLTMGKKDFNPIPTAKDKDVPPIRLGVIYPNGTEKVTGYIPQTPASFISVKINGIDGIGYESKPDDVGNVQPATIRWWDNKTLYTLYGHMSVQELVKIAESMK